MLSSESDKDLEKWFDVKAHLRRKQNPPFFKEGELWWCSIGMNVGDEEFGKGPKLARPVLIFKKINSNLFLGIPIITRDKNGSWYVDVWCEGKKRTALLNQVRVLDNKRLLDRICTTSVSSFRCVKIAFTKFYIST